MAGYTTGKKKLHCRKKAWKKLRTGKRRPKDLDQIQDDIANEQEIINSGKELIREFDEDLPEGGQFFCVPCSRYFDDERVLELHQKCKIHKKNVKKANEPQYTQKEAEEAAGMTHE